MFHCLFILKEFSNYFNENVSSIITNKKYIENVYEPFNIYIAYNEYLSLSNFSID